MLTLLHHVSQSRHCASTHPRVGRSATPELQYGESRWLGKEFMAAHKRSHTRTASFLPSIAAIAAVVWLAAASAANGQCPTSFAPPARYGGGDTPYSVAIGDLNGDGKLDLVTPNGCCANVFVLLGNGDGTFQKAAEYGADDTPAFVAIGDMNGDGAPDLAVANI